jgi:glutamate-1-semialdehyde 2,1-aminomutase
MQFRLYHTYITKLVNLQEMAMTKSKNLFNYAIHVMPGGVNSPVRAWKAVGGSPFFVEKGKGSMLYDVDGNGYIDYVCSWGPLILGHAHPVVVKAVEDVIADGFSFGAPTEREIALAKKIIEAVPSIQKVRLVNSGTEATLSAIRLARAYTKRDKIIKMIGGYHGHHDALLAQAGSGVATLSIPSTPGVPAAVVQDTILVPYNDSDAVRAAFETYPGQIAAVIVEPVAGNMGCIPPAEGYLQSLRVITTNHDAILIFDEVMSGFRVAKGGAQARYGVLPDLTTLGKVIGGGMPIGAYGGLEELMSMMAPEGNVYQAGTLSGNPIATACGLATLGTLDAQDFYDDLETKGKILEEGFYDKAREAGVPIMINRVGSMMTVFFTEYEVTDFEQVSASNIEAFNQFWNGMLKEGVFLPPSAFEAFFISCVHSNRDLEKTIRAAGTAFNTLAQKRIL